MKSSLHFKEIRVALIKQDTYKDLYVALPCDPDFYKASPRRSGPLSIPEVFSCDFYIVKTTEDDECKLYEKKVLEAGHGSIDDWLKVPSEYRINGLVQADCAIDVSEVPFSSYDIIISIDISVPERIVKTFSNQLWCYFISEPPLSAWKNSWLKPLYGYDIFLTQCFRTDEEISKAKQFLPLKHTIDLPYVSAGSETYNRLFGFTQKSPSSDAKPSATIPGYRLRQLSTEQLAKLSQYFEIIKPSGMIGNYLSSLNNSEFYLRLGNKSKFGNETIEAVASNCVFISSPKGWRNRIFNVPSTVLTSSEIDDQITQAIELASHFRADIRRKINAMDCQTRILDRICYYKPILSIVEQYERKRLRRSRLFI